MNRDKQLALVDECLGLVRDHRLIAMEKRMKSLEARLLALRNSINEADPAEASISCKAAAGAAFQGTPGRFV